MRISYNWLNDYVDIRDKTPEEISDVLTNLGFEIEGEEKKRYDIENVVVAKVLDCQKHPNADKLSLCRVSDGKKEYSVVCGAPNVAAGQTVPLAYIGAVLPGGLKLRKAKIRGVESEGMICSAKELGIESESAGIMELDSTLEAGQNIVDVLNLRDVIFEVNVTPNRGDALSHLGIARELAAYFDIPLKKNRKYDFSFTDKFQDFEVIIEAPDACPRYTAQIIRNVEVKESPYWLKMRLFDMGLNPINNVVDFTNYVLFDTGQPLHAFDLEKLRGNKIIVRFAREGEKILLLNDEELELSEQDLVICDTERPVALAGIMGGQETAVTENTRNILLESAFFTPRYIRKTSKRHGVTSDSSYRFERYIDIENVPVSAFECALFFQQQCSGQIDKQILDSYPIKYEAPRITFSYSRINDVLGLDMPIGKMENLLKALGFEKAGEEQDKVTYKVPSFRRDVFEDMDFAEEIARHYGYNNIPVTMPVAPVLENVDIKKREFYYNLKNILRFMGYNEVVNYSFLNPDILGKVENERKRIEIVNELSYEQKVLRTSLLPQLIQRFKYNVNRGETLVKLFELGKVYYINEAGAKEEQDIVAGIAGGVVDELKWYAKEREYDFYDLKGEVEKLLKMINQSHSLETAENRLFFSGSYFVVKDKAGEIIGFFGFPSLELIQSFEVDMPFGYFEFYIEKLKPEKRMYTKVPKYPALKRDISLVINRKQNIGEILMRIKELQPKIVEDIKIFDIYESEKIGKDNRSITVNVLYRSKNKTLTDEEVNKINDFILKTLQKEFGATLRER